MGVSARAFFAQALPGKSMSDASRESGVSYSAIRQHVKYGGALTVPSALKLEKWSGGEISAIASLGLLQ